MDLSFEQGPIRPPSEAGSLLIRVTRNCPWNKCAFCHTYDGTKFELRSAEEIKKDIDRIAAIANEIMEYPVKEEGGSMVKMETIGHIYGGFSFYNDSYRSVANWLYHGGDSVFIQDADSLIMKTDDLASVLACIKKTFPFVKRITTYCRSKTAARKSVADLILLRDSGLDRIHVGMESGYDQLLKMIKKGVTAAEHIEAGRKIREAGISLCEYVMPGLGGERWSKEHAEETASVVNAINPDFVRLRSLYVTGDTPLMEMIIRGEFTPLCDESVLQEIRDFIFGLQGIQTTIVSDHILNLLEELEGGLPEDKPKLLAIIDRYFSLSQEERLIFRLGRRRGIYRKIDDLADKGVYEGLKEIVDQYNKRENGALEKHLSMIMHNYI
jgi:histone acetyltransferase (RNA polymerase elongator complex component)